MKIHRLSEQEERHHGFTHKIVVTHADVTGTGATKTLPIFPVSGNVAVGTVVWDAAFRLVTAFDASGNASLTSLTMTVGDDGDVDRFLVSREIHIDGTEIKYDVSAPSTTPYVYTTANAIDAAFTGSASQALDDLDSGEIEIFLKITDLEGLKA